MKEKFHYSNNSVLVERLLIGLKIYLIVQALAIISGMATYLVLSGADPSLESLEMNDIRQGIVGLIQFILFVVTSILFLYWFYAAYRNVHALQALEATKAPSWAIWGFIVPIIALYYPYQIATEIWIGTQEFIRTKNKTFSVNQSKQLIGWWWAFFIISNVLGRFLFRSSDNLSPLYSNLVFLISDCIDLIGLAITLKMVEQISEAEELMHEAHLTQTNEVLWKK